MLSNFFQRYDANELTKGFIFSYSELGKEMRFPSYEGNVLAN